MTATDVASLSSDVPRTVTDDLPAVIEAVHLAKMFKIYPKPNGRLWEWLSGNRIKRHDEFWALRDVNLSVRRGECLGIIGENGSGKSTLLKILTGTMSATSGAARVEGRVLALIELGTGFNSQLTGAENIRLAAQLLGLESSYLEQRFDDIVEFASLGDFIDRPIKLYSSGMLVRLAFSLFAFLEPEVLIVDEALAVGDAAFQRKCYRRMEEMITSQQRAVILVTHDLHAVTKFCTRAIWLDHGKMRMTGPPVPVVEAYLKQVLGRHEAQSEPTEGHAARHPEDAGGGATYTAPEISAAAAAASKKIPSHDLLPRTEAAVFYPADGMELLGAWLEDDRGAQTTVISLDESFRICYAVRFSKDQQEPIFGLRVTTIRGDPLIATNTQMSRVRTRGYVSGDVEVLRWPVASGLNVGDYFLSIGCSAGDGSGAFLLRHVDAYFFSVRGSSRSGALCSLTREPMLSGVEARAAAAPTGSVI